MLGFIATLLLVLPLATAAPRVVAHRGLLLDSPENTIANYRACLELRMGFEFDVQRTSDGHLVSIHDDLVDRTTNGKGNVSSMTLAQIRGLDAGSWFGPAFAGQTVPIIEEVFALLAAYRHTGVILAADLKSKNVEADMVRLAEKHKVLDNVLFIGRTIVEPGVRQQLRRASPRAHTAMVANNAAEFGKALRATDADWVYFRYLPSHQEMDSVRRAGKKAFIAGATVAENLPENWKRAAAVGIDAILTDYAPELGRVLRGR